MNEFKNRILQGDCIEVLRDMLDNSVDSVVTDPPYGLSKEPDIREVLTKWMAGEDYEHRGGGFMGKSWDSFVPGPSVWREVYRVLKPGGHALVFAGTRTQDLMTISLRLAGFEVRDVIEWLYFQGFPKSMDVGKQFDKRKGGAAFVHEFAKIIKKKRLEKGYSLAFMDKEVCGGTTNYSWFEGRPAGVRLPQLKEYYKIKELLDLDDTYDEMMEEAERKKIGEKAWTNSAHHFVPGENHKERVKLDITAPATDLARKWNGWGTALKPAHEPIIVVRKPLEGTVCENVEKYGTGAINIDGCRIAFADEMDKQNAKPGGRVTNSVKHYTVGGRTDREEVITSQHEKGRFPANCITLDDDQFYSKYFNITPPELSKKASKKDRNSDWRGEEIALEPKEARYFDGGKFKDGGFNDGRKVANNHPTVKPTDLMAWLVRLVTPPNGVVLDPFAGSGSTLVAAKREGFGFIGIEREAEYIEIARVRTGETS